MDSFSHLPLEIFFNVLSRLSLKTLLQLRCVSKRWINIIHHPDFAHAAGEPLILRISHLTHKPQILSLHAAEEDGEVLKASESSIAEFENLSAYSLEGSCNGLLYFVESCEHLGVVLINPFISREVVTLPPRMISSPWPRMSQYGMGFDCSTNMYKVVRVFFRELNWATSCYRLGAEIHTLGTQSWREISQFPPCPLFGRPVFARGALHWIVDQHFAPSNSENLIVSFNIRNDEFKSVPCPDFVSKGKDSDLIQLVELRGNLAMAVVHRASRRLEMSVLVDFEKEWVREFCIDIQNLGSDVKYIKVIGCWDRGEILLTCFDEFYSYNVKTDLLRHIQTPSLFADTRISEVYSHGSSLVSISRTLAAWI